MKLHQLTLILLRGIRHGGVGADARGTVDVGANPLESSWHGRPGGPRTPLALFVARGEPLRKFPLASRFDIAAGTLKRNRKHEVRVGVRRISPDGFPEPIRRSLDISLQHVGVAEIE